MGLIEFGGVAGPPVHSIAWIPVAAVHVTEVPLVMGNVFGLKLFPPLPIVTAADAAAAVVVKVTEGVPAMEFAVAVAVCGPRLPLSVWVALAWPLAPVMLDGVIEPNVVAQSIVTPTLGLLWLSRTVTTCVTCVFT